MARLSGWIRTGLVIGAAHLPVFLVVAEGSAAEPQSGNFLQIGSTIAENVRIETELATYVIKRIELHGTNLTNASLSELFDPKNNLPVPERLTKLTADEVVIPELTMTTKSEPFQKITYEDIKLQGIKSGVAVSVDVAATHFEAADAKPGAMQGKYGHLHAQAIDLPLAAHIASEVRRDTSEPLRPLYESFSVEDLAIKDSGKNAVTVTITKLAGLSAKARAFAARPSDFAAAASDSRHLALLLKDVFTSLDIDGLTATGIAVTLPEEGHTPTYFALANATAGKISNLKLATAVFGSFALQLPDATLKINDLNFKDIDFQKLRDFSVSALSKETEADEEVVSFIPRLMQANLDKIGVEHNKPGKPPEPWFTIAHFQANGSNVLDGVPTQSTSALDHFSLDVDPVKQPDMKALADMGYSKLDLSGRVDVTWDPATEQLIVKDVSLSGPDMGALTISGQIDGVGKDFFSGDPASMQAAAFGALVKKIEIRIENGGFFDRAMVMQAKAQNKSVEDIKRAYVSAAAIGLPSLLMNKPAAKIIGAAAAKFIANPKSFHLIATSADGLGASDFAMMTDPSAFLDALEIKALANE